MGTQINFDEVEVTKLNSRASRQISINDVDDPSRASSPLTDLGEFSDNQNVIIQLNGDLSIEGGIRVQPQPKSPLRNQRVIERLKEKQSNRQDYNKTLATSSYDQHKGMEHGDFGRYTQSACYNYLDLNHQSMDGKPIFPAQGGGNRNVRASLNNALPRLQSHLTRQSQQEP